MDSAPVIDLYAPLSHKEALNPDAHRPTGLAPTWVPTDDQRRLTAYYVLDAYRTNTARNLLPSDSPHLDKLREYGEADLLVDRIVAGILGTDWQISVDGADFDATTITLAPRPTDAPDDATKAEAALAALQQAQWDRDATETVAQATAAAEAVGALAARQAEIRAWADDIGLASRIDEAEHDAVGLGDAVYVLWPRTGDWPTVSVYDPGHYFPALDDDGDVTAFPTSIVLAWEYEVTENGTTTRFLRRISFDLVEIAALRVDPDNLGAWLGPDGLPAPAPTLATTERLGDDGRIRRAYPWTPDGTPADELSPWTCLLSDGTWDLSNTSMISGLTDLGDDAAVWRMLDDGTELRNLDMGQDFLPVVHVPHTASSKEHYGRSALSPVAQVLDDLAGADTDTAQSSRYLSDPTLALSGARVDGESVVAPGRVFGLGENGRMDVLDLSAGLEKLMAHRDALADRFWVNGKVPKSIAGKVSAGEAASGLAMALEMAPYATMLGAARMARDLKYRLIYRFAQRMAQLQGVLVAGPTPTARMAWGSYLPTDRLAMVDLVAKALEAHAISTHTAVAMLVGVGFPVVDASAEVARILSENTERAKAAKDIADATGSEALAADYLGMSLPKVAAPVLQLP